MTLPPAEEAVEREDLPLPPDRRLPACMLGAGPDLLGSSAGLDGQKAFVILRSTSSTVSSMKMAESGSDFDIFSCPALIRSLASF